MTALLLNAYVRRLHLQLVLIIARARKLSSCELAAANPLQDQEQR